MHSMKTDLVEKFCKHYGFQARFTRDHDRTVLAIDTLDGAYRLGFDSVRIKGKNAADSFYFGDIFEFPEDDRETAAGCFLANLLDSKRSRAMLLIKGPIETSYSEDLNKILRPRSLEELEIFLDLSGDIQDEKE